MSPNAENVRNLHRVSLGKYSFMLEFLTQQWQVVEEEKNNPETTYKVSIINVWDSFNAFLEVNGYPSDCCSKILFGKLLKQAGVEKVKRGPRYNQKFYYYPLVPVEGSMTEAMMSTVTQDPDACGEMREQNYDSDSTVKKENLIATEAVSSKNKDINVTSNQGIQFIKNEVVEHYDFNGSIALYIKE
ncbi:uncharacterized protein LOC108680004 isoform X1 [Hyalella azteca]|uniref:Uncharacterized protein LOC108680004 isoform X1 n=1 Tax=Hyalella azteca TaxID=294128 RepID=A0A8B7PDR3_HYAAZ|nr:uncharacterized protein LOC108680004 isoform X1 [Hyalella azteca]